jgi:Derlin-2/3
MAYYTINLLMLGFLQHTLDWLNTPPRITRWLLVPTLTLPFLSRFGFISPYSLIHDWSMIIWPKFQLWRVFTPLFCSGFGIQLLFTCYFRYQCMHQLELSASAYMYKPADLVFFLIFSTAMFNLVNTFIPLLVFEEALTMAIVYIWSQFFKDNIVTFLFGMRFPAPYFPWVLLLMDLLYEKSLIGSIVGLLVGHLYYFLYTIYPSTSGRSSILSTPMWLERLFPRLSTSRAPNTNPEPRSNSFGGVGYRLGSGSAPSR